MSATADILFTHIATAFAEHRKHGKRCLVVGLCGAQGSGKSTAAAGVAERLGSAGVRTAVLSLDDLYLTRGERSRLAREVHPLLQTRGVPGTHEVRRGIELIDGLVAGAPQRLPRFDKAQDTTSSEDDWPLVSGPVDVILFEGWCVGARPQAADELLEPVNWLERTADCDGRWRRYVNDALAGDYQLLFDRIDMLVLIAAPEFEVVVRWRQEQEHQLRARLANEGRRADHLMDDEQIERFTEHYERLTRHILTEMPRRAQLVLELDAARRLRDVRRNGLLRTG